jgi:Uncharacterized protein conserved in bacteria (DUF2199)
MPGLGRKFPRGQCSGSNARAAPSGTKACPATARRRLFNYYSVPNAERSSRCVLSTDMCVVDQKSFFVHGCLEIPVQGEPETFIWGVWVSLSKRSFDQFVECFDAAKRRRRNLLAPRTSIELIATCSQLELLAAGYFICPSNIRCRVRLRLRHRLWDRRWWRFVWCPGSMRAFPYRRKCVRCPSRQVFLPLCAE